MCCLKGVKGVDTAETLCEHQEIRVVYMFVYVYVHIIMFNGNMTIQLCDGLSFNPQARID